MTSTRATVCLALALTGCVGVGTDPTPATTASLSRDELCRTYVDLVGSELSVLGPFDADVVTPNGGSVAFCDPGTCCNLTYYAPTIGCENGPRIAVTFDAAMLEDVTAPDRLDFVCRTISDDLRPSEACPVDARCAEELGRVASLRGRLERRMNPVVGAEQITLVVTESSSLAPGGL